MICVCVCVFAGRVFNGSGKPIDRGPAVLAEDFLDIMGQFSGAAVVVCVSTEEQMHRLPDWSSAEEDDSITLSSVDGTIFFILQVSPSTLSVASTRRR